MDSLGNKVVQGNLLPLVDCFQVPAGDVVGLGVDRVPPSGRSADIRRHVLPFLVIRFDVDDEVACFVGTLRGK